MEQSDAVWRKLRHPHTIQIRPCSLIPTTTLAFPALLCLRTALHRFHRPHPRHTVASARFRPSKHPHTLHRKPCLALPNNEMHSIASYTQRHAMNQQSKTGQDQTRTVREALGKRGVGRSGNKGARSYLRKHRARRTPRPTPARKLSTDPETPSASPCSLSISSPQKLLLHPS